MSFDIKFYKVKIYEIIDNASNSVKTFIVEKPKNFKHRPGQFCWLDLEHNKNQTKSYRIPMAIASGTNESKLMFSFRSWGEATKEFFKLKKKNKILISDAMGTHLPFESYIGSQFYLIAGGTGITPIRSFLFSIKNPEKYTLFYGASSPKDFLFLDDLKQFKTNLIVEGYEESEKWDGDTGYVTKLLTNKLDTKNGMCYVCGPHAMMQNVVSILKHLGFSEDQIFVSIEKMENNEVIGPVFLVSNPNIDLA